MKPIYEYKVEMRPLHYCQLQDFLNSFGAAGWELVTVIRHYNNELETFYFKRRKG